MIVAIIVAYLIPPMPLYSDIYKTANHEGDILLRASPTIMLVSFAILAAVGVISGLSPLCVPHAWTPSSPSATSKSLTPDPHPHPARPVYKSRSDRPPRRRLVRQDTCF